MWASCSFNPAAHEFVPNLATNDNLEDKLKPPYLQQLDSQPVQHLPLQHGQLLAQVLTQLPDLPLACREAGPFGGPRPADGRSADIVPCS